MRSMTGFGRGSSAGENFSISVELKAVNNRFLDVSLRLPAELQAIESAIRTLIGKRLSRGRIDVTFQSDISEEMSYEVNEPLIAGYLNAMKKIGDQFSLSGEPDINVIARLPNALSIRKQDVSEAFTAAAEKAVADALDDLELMRENEGRMLAAELETRLAEIEKRLEPITQQAAAVADEYSQKLSRRVGELLARSGGDIELDQARLAQEVAYLAERADISEEIARLRSHIEHFRSIMTEDKEVGKRLDFLTQELNREANTITSKTGNMVIKENALQIKSEIEKIREQVQNIE